MAALKRTKEVGPELIWENHEHEEEQVMNVKDSNLVQEVIDKYGKEIFQKALLKDRTTGRNITWGTNEYHEINEKFLSGKGISITDISGHNSGIIRPRVAKSLEAQQKRTKKRAEVFTPSWVCNQMNNNIDDDYLGYKGAFNFEKDKDWVSTWKSDEWKHVEFPEGTSWEDYIMQLRMEITCGEAPFVTSRYYPTSGEYIKVQNRVGFLDRKLRIAAENCNGAAYKKWSFKALEQTYGFEFQGDNLLLARVNVFLTWMEHWEAKLGELPLEKEAMKAAKIISWNFWQMDGLKGTVPHGLTSEFEQQWLPGMEPPVIETPCKIKDWSNGKSLEYNTLKN